MILKDYMVKTETVLKKYEEKPFEVFGFIAEYLTLVGLPYERAIPNIDNGFPKRSSK